VSNRATAPVTRERKAILGEGLGIRAFLAEVFYLPREKDEAPVDPLQIEFEGYHAGFGVAGRGKYLPQSHPARGRGNLSHRLIEVIFDAHAASLSRLVHRLRPRPKVVQNQYAIFIVARRSASPWRAEQLAPQLELCLPRLASSPAPEGSIDGLRAFSRNPGHRASPQHSTPLTAKEKRQDFFFATPNHLAILAKRENAADRKELVRFQQYPRGLSMFGSLSLRVLGGNDPWRLGHHFDFSRELLDLGDDLALDQVQEVAAASAWKFRA
jgi:hypothetical protein